MNKTIITIMCVIALLFIGCNKTNTANTTPSNGTNEVHVAASTMNTKQYDASTNVVLKIGSTPITIRQCDEQCRLMIALKENRNNIKYTGVQWTNEYRNAMKRMPNFLWYKTSILAEASKSNFVFTAVPDSFKKSYLKNVRKPRQSIDKLIASLGPMSNVVVQTMENDYRIMSFIQTTFSNELIVTENDIKQAVKRIEDYNDAASATNELALAKANTIAREIIKGLPIKEAIAKYGEDTWNDDKFDVLTIDATDFLSESDWLDFKKHDIRQPTRAYEIEDGYAIYYKIGNEDVGTFEAYRIFLRRAELVDEMEDDEIRLELTDSKRENVMKKFLPIAFGNNPIEFPFGKNTFLKMFGL